MKNFKKGTPKSARKIVPLLGIGIDSTHKRRLLKTLFEYASQAQKPKINRRPIFIVTPNPEIVLKAQEDRQLAEIINKADFALPDGHGLGWVVRYLYGARLEVIPGRVLFRDLITEAQKRGWKVFLLGGEKGVAREAAAVLVTHYPQLTTRYHHGPRLDEQGKPVDGAQRRVEGEVIEHINQQRPHFLFVGFGAPKQEKWLARNLPRLKVGVAMTVGGTLDYWAGKVPLPPQLIEKLGLEWLWRLLWQPWRFTRIFRATVIFPLKVIWYRLTH